MKKQDSKIFCQNGVWGSFAKPSPGSSSAGLWYPYNHYITSQPAASQPPGIEYLATNLYQSVTKLECIFTQCEWLALSAPHTLQVFFFFFFRGGI
jgi:hypothetical protein